MPQSIREVMTANPVSLPATTSLVDAARRMKDDGIGDVLVADGDDLRGLVTDRDIVVRAVAEGRDSTSTTLGEVCSADLVTLDPGASVHDAVELMSERAVRRLPVVENGALLGYGTGVAIGAFYGAVRPAIPQLRQPITGLAVGVGRHDRRERRRRGRWHDRPTAAGRQGMARRCRSACVLWPRHGCCLRHLARQRRRGRRVGRPPCAW